MAIWYKGGTESRHSDALLLFRDPSEPRVSDGSDGLKKDTQDSENASKKIGHNAVQEMIESLYY